MDTDLVRVVNGAIPQNVKVCLSAYSKEYTTHTVRLDSVFTMGSQYVSGVFRNDVNTPLTTM
jgi:hypothetical protein